MKIFVTGIDTDAGKSFATGYLARTLADSGKRVTTMKFIQTGNHDYSEDIDIHRRIMGIPLQPEDLNHTTAPVIFSYPCSPQLAAAIDGLDIDFNKIDHSADSLDTTFDITLIEGAGGLMVPLTDDFWTIDYISTRRLPVALVTNGQLGSISHTLLALETLLTRKIPLHYILYNTYFDSDKTIVADTRDFLKRYLHKHFSEAQWIDIPPISIH